MSNVSVEPKTLLRASLRELRPTLTLAVPVIVAHLSQMLIGITDTAFIGRVGTVELAASAFAHSFFGMVYVTGVGLLLPVAVLVARDHGAGNLTGCWAWLKHGRVLGLATGVLACALLVTLMPFLGSFGQPPEVIAVMRPFYLLNALSIVPVFYFQVQRQYLDALGRPWVGTCVILGDVVLNALLNWCFIWGHLGAPALGLTGSGVATLLARTLAVTAIAWWLRNERKSPEPLSRARFVEMLHIGVPASGCLLFESGAFSSAALMMGWLGAATLAAHQITLNCASFTFMIPLGLSMAVSIRVSRAVGSANTPAVRAIGFGGIGFAIAAMLVSAATFILGGTHLAHIYTTDRVVVELAAQLLVVAAAFQTFDGAQVVAAGALRGITDVRVPTIITFIAYWVIRLPISYVLGFRTQLAGVGVWIGLAAGLGFAAVLLAHRFQRLTRMPQAAFT